MCTKKQISLCVLLKLKDHFTLKNRDNGGNQANLCSLLQIASSYTEINIVGDYISTIILWVKLTILVPLRLVVYTTYIYSSLPRKATYDFVIQSDYVLPRETVKVLVGYNVHIHRYFPTHRPILTKEIFFLCQRFS